MSHREWILVVESDPRVAESIRWCLAETGLRVVIVSDGLAALEAFFDDPPPTLVTLELNVPSVSGFRLIELFKRHSPKIPVLVVTSLEFEEATDAIRAGADDFVTKPINAGTFVKRVLDLLPVASEAGSFDFRFNRPAATECAAAESSTAHQLTPAIREKAGLAVSAGAKYLA